jgi:hypothetical protein
LTRHLLRQGKPGLLILRRGQSRLIFKGRLGRGHFVTNGAVFVPVRIDISWSGEIKGTCISGCSPFLRCFFRSSLLPRPGTSPSDKGEPTLIPARLPCRSETMSFSRGAAIITARHQGRQITRMEYSTPAFGTTGPPFRSLRRLPGPIPITAGFTER